MDMGLCVRRGTRHRKTGESRMNTSTKAQIFLGHFMKILMMFLSNIAQVVVSMLAFAMFVGCVVLPFYVAYLVEVTYGRGPSLTFFLLYLAVGGATFKTVADIRDAKEWRRLEALDDDGWYERSQEDSDD